MELYQILEQYGEDQYKEMIKQMIMEGLFSSNESPDHNSIKSTLKNKLKELKVSSVGDRFSGKINICDIETMNKANNIIKNIFKGSISKSKLMISFINGTKDGYEQLYACTTDKGVYNFTIKSCYDNCTVLDFKSIKFDFFNYGKDAINTIIEGNKGGHRLKFNKTEVIFYPDNDPHLFHENIVKPILDNIVKNLKQKGYNATYDKKAFSVYVLKLSKE